MSNLISQSAFIIYALTVLLTIFAIDANSQDGMLAKSFMKANFKYGVKGNTALLTAVLLGCAGFLVLTFIVNWQATLLANIVFSIIYPKLNSKKN